VRCTKLPTSVYVVACVCVRVCVHLQCSAGGSRSLCITVTWGWSWAVCSAQWQRHLVVWASDRHSTWPHRQLLTP